MGLEDYFEVGEWYTYDEIKNGVNFRITNYKNGKVIYAFIQKGKVKYIGICKKDITSLRSRLDRYKYLSGGSINKRVAREIKSCLEQGKNIKIYALKPRNEFKYKNLNVDLVKGVGKPLIKKFKPEWNIIAGLRLFFKNFDNYI